MEFENSCIWVFQIYNCKESKQLKIINIIGISYTCLIILILSSIFKYFYIKNKHKQLFGKLNLGLLISFLIRFIYLILLYTGKMPILFLCVLQEIGWILFVGTYNLLLYDIAKLLKYDNIIEKICMKKINIFNKPIYITNIFYILTFLCSFISGIFFQYENKKGYIFLGIQFFIWGLIVFYVGSFCLIFLYRYNKQLKKILENTKDDFVNKNNEKFENGIKKINIVILIVIPNVIFFPVLWIYQSIHMYFMQKMYSLNIIIISLLWYWLAISIATTFCVFLLFYQIYTIEE